MKKFMVLYTAPIAAMEKMMKAPPEQMKAGMEAWMKWNDVHADAIVDLGTPLGKTRRVTATGASDTRNEIGGFSIVQGDSLEAVEKIFADHPHFKTGEGAAIEVIECMEMPGM